MSHSHSKRAKKKRNKKREKPSGKNFQHFRTHIRLFVCSKFMCMQTKQEKNICNKKKTNEKLRK